MRTFLAKNGLMNNTLRRRSACSTRSQTASFLDWRGIVITFVWKQVPFVTLMLAGAMASLDRATIEAGRNLGASRLRVLVEIVLPQVGADAARRPRPVLRDHALGALGADDGRRARSRPC